MFPPHRLDCGDVVCLLLVNALLCIDIELLRLFSGTGDMMLMIVDRSS